MKKSIILIAISIVIGAIIISGGLMYNQQLKQKIIIQQQKQEQERYDQEQELEIKKHLQLAECIDDAEYEYWSYVDLNATSSKQTADGVEFNAPQKVYDEALKRKEAYIKQCEMLWK